MKKLKLGDVFTLPTLEEILNKFPYEKSFYNSKNRDTGSLTKVEFFKVIYETKTGCEVKIFEDLEYFLGQKVIVIGTEYRGYYEIVICKASEFSEELADWFGQDLKYQSEFPLKIFYDESRLLDEFYVKEFPIEIKNIFNNL